METRPSNADDVRSAILNCICPECGDEIELETSELKCLGRCGKRWQDIRVWTQLHFQEGRRDDLSRRDVRLGSIGVQEEINLEALAWAMKIKELIEEATKALRAAIRGEHRPRPIIFDSIKDLSNALIRAKEAHSEFERGSGVKDYNWPLWYAAYIAMEQGVAEKSASKLAGSAIEVSPGSEKCAAA